MVFSWKCLKVFEIKKSSRFFPLISLKHIKAFRNTPNISSWPGSEFQVPEVHPSFILGPVCFARRITAKASALDLVIVVVVVGVWLFTVFLKHFQYNRERRQLGYLKGGEKKL